MCSEGAKRSEGGLYAAITSACDIVYVTLVECPVHVDDTSLSYISAVVLLVVDTSIDYRLTHKLCVCVCVCDSCSRLLMCMCLWMTYGSRPG